MTRASDDTATPASTAMRNVTDRLITAGVIAVVRLPDVTRAGDAAQALVDGGVTALEITLTTPGALRLITLLAANTQLLVGAGSVLDAQQAKEAIDAGASYIVSPVLVPDVITTAHAHHTPAMPGAYTPTEILAAHRAGADVIKVFPADGLGPSYLRSVLAPMPFLPLMPTGGVTPENAGTWIQAGAVAVGIGSALMDPKLVHAGEWDILTARARTACDAVRRARTGGEG